MAHVQKRVRGGQTRWIARLRGPDGRERSKVFNRKVDAERWLAEQSSSQARGVWSDPRLGRILYREWVAEWMATSPPRRASTEARNRSLINTHLLPAFGDWQIAGIRQRDVVGWIARLTRKGLAASTVRECYGLLGRTLRAAVAAGLIGTSPCHDALLPKVEHEDMRFLTVGELERLAECIRPAYRTLVLVGGYAGLRIGELAGLRRERVDLLRGTVDIAEALTEVEGRLQVGPPKTKAGRRTVSLPRSIVDELAAEIAGLAPGAYVWTAPAGGPLRVLNWRRRIWRPAVASAGLEPLTPHDLRHTAVSLWIAQGANPKEVARRAGHTSVAFTLDRYGHLFPGFDDELVAGLDAARQSGINPGSEWGHVVRFSR